MTPRKIITLLLCAAMLAFIITGPGIFKRYNEKDGEYIPPKQTAEWTGIITVWDYPRLDTRTGLRFSWMKEKIKQFEKDNPGVYIEFRELTQKDGPTLLKAVAKTGATPDIAPVGSDPFFVSRGILESLDRSISPDDRQDYLKSALDTATCNGRLYGLPWMTTGYTLLLNTDIFSERNVPLPQNGSWTYEQFAEAIKSLTYDTNGRGGPDVYGFSSFVEPGSYNAFGILLSDGAQIIDSDTGAYSFNTPEALSGLRKLCAIKSTYKAAVPQFGAMSEGEAWSAFLNGKAAIYTGASWTVPFLRNLQGDKTVNFTTASFPTGKSGKPVTLSGDTCSFAVFRQKDAGKREMCIKFIKFLTAKESQNDLMNLGYFPVRKSGEGLYQNDKEMYGIQQSLKYAQPLPRLPKWDEIDLILQSRIKAALCGEVTPEKALQDAEEQIRGRMK